MKSRIILVAVIALAVLGGYAGRAPRVTGRIAAGGFSDLDLFESVAAGVAAGESYYDAYGSLRREHNRSTRPVFAWRLPTLTYAMVVFPFGRILLVALAVTMLWAWAVRLRPELGLGFTCLALVLLAPSVVLAAVRRGYLQYEIWTGILIALSLAWHGRRTALSVAAGLAALFIRELALPYVLLMLVLAVCEGRRREWVAWLVGVSVFAVYYAIHVVLVHAHQLPGDVAVPSWVRFGGWSHVAACSAWIGCTLIPYWLAGSATVLGAYGLLSSRNLALMLTGVGYMAAFAIFGNPFNDYWGLVYAPLLAIGLAYSIPAMAALWRGEEAVSIGDGRPALE